VRVSDFVDRAHRFARRRVGETQLAAPAERTWPLPDGWTEREIATLMRTFSIGEGDPGHLAAYADDSLGRFLHTWGLVRDLRGRALELGANPYFTTWLLRRFTSLHLTLANYFGEEFLAREQLLSYVDKDGEVANEKFSFDSFNLEKDPFPYPDGEFDVVLFCEIIEHLLVDPLHALRQIHRVTAPDGILIVTTPNVARLGNVLSIVEGGNIYDPYSGHGPYGRHNREFTLDELVRLLRFAGFDAEHAFTANAHHENYESRRFFAGTMALVNFRNADLGQYLFVAARRRVDSGEGFPRWLYRSHPDSLMASE
jgi:SAM-dependent methyltransferase